jgi:hypothetical protein
MAPATEVDVPEQNGEPSIKVVPIGDLVPDAANVRVRDERARRTLESSLKQFGPARSIVVDGRQVVRAGNGTLEAAQAAGVAEVLVVKPAPGQLVAVERDDWSPAEATAYSIADNRIAELATWDDQGLAGTVDSLRIEGIDLGTIGFTASEIDSLLARVSGQQTEELLDQIIDSDSGEEEESIPSGSVPAGYKSFVVVFTESQDTDVREAIKLCKGLHNLETTPEALHRIASEYIELQKELV